MRKASGIPYPLSQSHIVQDKSCGLTRSKLDHREAAAAAAVQEFQRIRCLALFPRRAYVNIAIHTNCPVHLPGGKTGYMSPAACCSRVMVRSPSILLGRRMIGDYSPLADRDLVVCFPTFVLVCTVVSSMIYCGCYDNVTNYELWILTHFRRMAQYSNKYCGGAGERFEVGFGPDSGFLAV